MPVLKPSTSSVQPQIFSLREVEKQAQGMLLRARQQAEALLIEAQHEAEALRNEAREMGIVEGRAEGRRLGEEAGAVAGKQEATAELKPRLAMLVKSLSSAAEQIEQSRQQLMASATADVCGLAVAIARKVVHRVAVKNDDVLTDTLSQALRFVVGQNDVRIAVHSSHTALLKEVMPSLQTSWPSLKHVEMISDDAVAPGGARILTRHGEIDATLDGMIDRVAAELCGGDVGGGET